MGRMRWEGFPDFDQSAFDQTVIEFLELWFTYKKKPLGRQETFGSPFCQVRQYQWLDGKNSLQHYYKCWHGLVSAWLGPLGSRRTDTALLLVDPRVIDFNYVIGGR